MTNEDAVKELKERVEMYSQEWNGACDEYRDVLQAAVDALELKIKIKNECNKHFNCEESCKFWDYSCGAGCVFSTAPNRW